MDTKNLLASDVADNTLKALDVVLINGARDAVRSNSLHAEAHTEGVHAGANERLQLSIRLQIHDLEKNTSIELVSGQM